MGFVLKGKGTRYHPIFKPLANKAQEYLDAELKEKQYLLSTINSSPSVIELGIDRFGNYYYLFPHDTSRIFVYKKTSSSAYYTQSPSEVLKAFTSKGVSLDKVTGVI